MAEEPDSSGRGLPSVRRNIGATSHIIRPKIVRPRAAATLKEPAVAAATTLKGPAVAAATTLKEPAVAACYWLMWEQTVLVRGE
jgi:hypothetical protein